MGLKIIGERTPFSGRMNAADLLAKALQGHTRPNPVILGIPRGGVVLASAIAKRLGAEADIVLARKLGAPGNPELAIGAITEGGDAILNESIISALGVSDYYVEAEKARQVHEIARRLERFRAAKPAAPRMGRNLIVVDDGVATGATMKATLHGLSALKPASLWCALPVGPEDTLIELAEMCDEVICLAAPVYFQAVGQFYEEFSQVTDEEVIECLRSP